MDPTRKAQINGHTVHEYYWAGSYPVYVDSRAAEGDFERVCERLRAEADLPTLLTTAKAGERAA